MTIRCAHDWLSCTGKRKTSTLAKFLTTLEVARRPTGRWVLLVPLVYRSDIPGVGVDGVLRVPTGFDTDFASVPRLPFMFWLLGDRGHAAAVVHDYLYRTAIVTRATADRVFHEALRADGEDAVSSWLMWTGVRVGGWAAYDQRHPENLI